MTNKIFSEVELNYRATYGKLFSGLINQFGVSYVSEIEDAIQNSFLKSLKRWKPNQIPNNKKNWLYIVARNDVINQIKKHKKQTTIEPDFMKIKESEIVKSDLRFQTILFLASSKSISTQTKVIFILKNIFGLHIREIAQCTLLNQDALYKSISRAKKSLQLEFENKQIDVIFEKITPTEISIVEEILYAVFNIGFDSFNEEIKSIVNEDLCLEAFSLTKLLFEKHKQDSSKNLLSLFCFHSARIPAKINNDKLISFFDQEKKKWNKELIDLGFYYLHKPKKMDKFYIESLIVSKYMTATSYSIAHWNDIIKLYEMLMKNFNSPIVILNYCYCLHKARRTKEALEVLENVKNKLPNGHLYFSLVKANILKETNPKASDIIISTTINKMNHTIRKEYLLENSFINLSYNENPKIN